MAGHIRCAHWTPLTLKGKTSKNYVKEAAVIRRVENMRFFKGEREMMMMRRRINVSFLSTLTCCKRLLASVSTPVGPTHVSLWTRAEEGFAVSLHGGARFHAQSDQLSKGGGLADPLNNGKIKFKIKQSKQNVTS